MSTTEWDAWVSDIENFHEEIQSMNLSSEQITNKNLSELKRAYHTYKGLFSSVGLTSSAGIIAEIEERIHQEGTSLQASTVESILEMEVKIELLLKEISINPPSGEMVQELERKIGFETVLIKSNKIYEIDIEIKADRAIKTARALAILNTIKRFAHIRSSSPSRDDLMLDLNFESMKVEIATLEPYEVLYQRILKLPSVSNVSIEVKERDTTNHVSTIRRQSIKIDSDDLVNLEQALTILNTQLEHLRGDLIGVEQKSKFIQIDSTFSHIEEDLRKLRKVAINSILEPLPGMVKRLAESELKEAELQIQGRFILINRALATVLIDPLTQIVRNAVIHGIEASHERTESGKNVVGLIQMSCIADRGKVIIKVSDDGGGIDEEVVNEKFKELDAETQGQLSSKYDVLFLEGFSTRKNAKKVAGRGIGLDAAKSKIEEIGGNITVESEKNKGTTFTITIPDQDIISKNLIVRVSNQLYSIQSSEVEKAFYLLDTSGIKLWGESHGEVKIDDAKYPLVLLRKLFDPNENGLNSQELVLICRGASHQIALVVDEIVDERLLSVRKLNPLLVTLEIFEGVVTGTEQAVMMVIDPSKFRVVA